MARYLHWRYIHALTETETIFALDIQHDKLMRMADIYKQELQEQYELAQVLQRQLKLPEGNPEREAALAYIESLKPAEDMTTTEEASADDTGRKENSNC